MKLVSDKNTEVSQILMSFYLKNGVFAIGIFILGIIGTIIAHAWASFFVAFLCSLFFVERIMSVYAAYKANRIALVKGLVVNAEEKTTIFNGQKVIYRVIPIDDAGNILDENGKFDVFLDFDVKKKSPNSLMIGASYAFVFKTDPQGDTKCDSNSLITLQRLQTSMHKDKDTKESVNQKQEPEQKSEQEPQQKKPSQENLIFLKFKK